MSQVAEVLIGLVTAWAAAAALGSIIGAFSFILVLDVLANGARGRRWLGAGLFALGVSLLCGGTLMTALIVLSAEDAPMSRRVTFGLLLFGFYAAPAVFLALAARRQFVVAGSWHRRDRRATGSCVS